MKFINKNYFVSVFMFFIVACGGENSNLPTQGSLTGTNKPVEPLPFVKNIYFSQLQVGQPIIASSECYNCDPSLTEYNWYIDQNGDGVFNDNITTIIEPDENYKSSYTQSGLLVRPKEGETLRDWQQPGKSIILSKLDYAKKIRLQVKAYSIDKKYESNQEYIVIEPDMPIELFGLYQNGEGAGVRYSSGKAITIGDESNDFSEADLTVGVTIMAPAQYGWSAVMKDGTFRHWPLSRDIYDADGLTIASDPVSMVSTKNSFAVLTADGSVATHGDLNSGGIVPNKIIDKLSSGVVKLTATRQGFTAIKDDGSLLSWGHQKGYVRDNTGNFASDIIESFSMTTNIGFPNHVALKNDGRLYGFGFGNKMTTGYDLPDRIGDSSGLEYVPNIKWVYPTPQAFAALTNDGKVIMIGTGDVYSDYERVVDEVNSGSPVKKVFFTTGAYAVLKEDGSVITWGDNDYGGDSSSVSDKLESGVVDIFPSGSAFSALKDDGSVVNWGARTVISHPYEEIEEGVKTIYTTSSGFIAEKDDGSLYYWGDILSNFRSVSEISDIGIWKVLGGNDSFVMILNDGTIVTIGDLAYRVPEVITNHKIVESSLL